MTSSNSTAPQLAIPELASALESDRAGTLESYSPPAIVWEHEFVALAAGSIIIPPFCLPGDPPPCP